MTHDELVRYVMHAAEGFASCYHPPGRVIPEETIALIQEHRRQLEIVVRTALRECTST